MSILTLPRESFKVGATFPWVISADHYAPQALDIARRLQPKIARVMHTSDPRDFERLREIGVEEFILRPKWHHGRGTPFLDNVLDASEWFFPDGAPVEITLRQCIQRLQSQGFYFVLEGPNEPCLECFEDRLTEDGRWLAEDPDIYIPKAEEFTDWWMRQLDMIFDAFPDIRVTSPPLSAGNIERARKWTDILYPVIERSHALSVHSYFWSFDEEGDGSIAHPAWGGMPIWQHNYFQEKPVIITEANCDARLLREQQVDFYPAMCDWFRNMPWVTGVCFFELPSSDGQERHALTFDVADALRYWQLFQEEQQLVIDEFGEEPVDYEDVKKTSESDESGSDLNFPNESETPIEPETTDTQPSGEISEDEAGVNIGYLELDGFAYPQALVESATETDGRTGYLGGTLDREQVHVEANPFDDASAAPHEEFDYSQEPQEKALIERPRRKRRNTKKNAK